MHGRALFLFCALSAAGLSCQRAEQGVPAVPSAPGRVESARADVAEVAERTADRPAEQRVGEESVTVVCEPRYYVEGCARDDGRMRLLAAPDPMREFQVDGFVLVVVRPAEHSGQVITMHHDGVLAAGSPYTLFAPGRRYEIRVPQNTLGRFTFALCSIQGQRKIVPD